MPEFPQDDLLAGIGKVVPLVSINMSKLDDKKFLEFCESEIEGLITPALGFMKKG